MTRQCPETINLIGDHHDQCELDFGHRGAHETTARNALSATLHWTANAYWLQAVTA